MQGYSKRVTRRNGLNQTYLEPGDVISTDKFGPITPPAIEGANVIHVFVDKCTRYAMILPGKEQTDEAYISNMKPVKQISGS